MTTKSTARTVEEFLSWEHIEKAMAARSLCVLDATHNLIKNSKAPSKTRQNELFALEIDKMAKTHLCYQFFKMSKDRVLNHNFKD